ncbi:hypothetical protein TURU_051559 [Turdus rufiventris]|nr:hypothetical protein TURU_051559 [Turdus rufiventris]
MSQLCPGGQEGQWPLGWVSNDVASRTRAVTVYPPALGTGEASPHVQCPLLGFSLHGEAGAHPGKGTEMGKGLEHRSDEEQLRKLGRKGGSGGASGSAQLPDRKGEPGAGWALLPGNSLKLCQGRLWLDIWRNFLMKGLSYIGGGCPGRFVPIPGGVQARTGCGTQCPGLGDKVGIRHRSDLVFLFNLINSMTPF